MQAKFSLAISLSKSALKTVCPWTCFWSFVIFVIAIQGCALQKSKGILLLSNCEIQGVWHMIFMKILRFPSHQRAKVRHQGCSSTFRAQLCTVPSLSWWYMFMFFCCCFVFIVVVAVIVGYKGYACLPARSTMQSRQLCDIPTDCDGPGEHLVW